MKLGDGFVSICVSIIVNKGLILGENERYCEGFYSGGTEA